MKVCPQCTSLRIRHSHPHTPSENFYHDWLGYRFYRCQQCNWRGKAKSVKKTVSARGNVGTKLAVYAVAVVVVLIFVLVLNSSGGTQPPQ